MYSYLLFQEEKRDVGGVWEKELFELDERRFLKSGSERVFLPPMLLVLLASKVQKSCIRNIKRKISHYTRNDLLELDSSWCSEWRERNGLLVVVGLLHSSQWQKQEQIPRQAQNDRNHGNKANGLYKKSPLFQGDFFVFILLLRMFVIPEEVIFWTSETWGALHVLPWYHLWQYEQCSLWYEEHLRVHLVLRDSCSWMGETFYYSGQ